MSKKVVICTLPSGKIIKYRAELFGSMDTELDYITAAKLCLIQDGEVSAEDLPDVWVDVFNDFQVN